MESVAVSLTNQVTGNFFRKLPTFLGSQPKYSHTPLGSDAETYIIRKDNGQSNKYVNIFDSKGNKIYTLERYSPRSKLWKIYNEPNKIHSAALSIGLFERRVDSSEGTTLLKPGAGMFGKLHRYFTDKQGNLYSWNRRSKNLERISNPKGKYEEHRVIVAAISQLRARRFEWELRVDRNAQLDTVLILATAFITLQTQWLLSRKTIPGTRHSAPDELKKSLCAVTSSGDGFVNNDVDQLRVYEPEPPSTKPRDFFSPPEFFK